MLPTFMAPLLILIEKSIISLSFEETDLDFTTIKYENELSKASDIEDVQMLNTFGNNALNLANVSQQIGLNKEKTIQYISDKLRVPFDLRMKEQEIIEQNQRMQEYQDKLMAQDMLIKQVQSSQENEEVTNG